MILFQLKCDSGHEFDAWFRNSAAYDAQAASACIACPRCGDTHISKAPMAPNLATGSSREDALKDGDPEFRAKHAAEEILKAVNHLRSQIEDNFDHVGDRFAEEARAIHYGESEKRSIYGQATDDEVGELVEEEIEFFRLADIPRRNN